MEKCALGRSSSKILWHTTTSGTSDSTTASFDSIAEGGGGCSFRVMYNACLCRGAIVPLNSQCGAHRTRTQHMHFTPDSSGTKHTSKTPSAEAAPYRSRLPQAAAPPLTLVHACRYRCTTFSKIARLPATVAANDRLPRRPAQNRSCSTAAIRTASPVLCSAAAAQKKSPLTTSSLVVSTPQSRAPFRLAGRRAGVAVEQQPCG